MSNAIRPPMGNSLSPEPCALIPSWFLSIHDLRVLAGKKRMAADAAKIRGPR